MLELTISTTAVGPAAAIGSGGSTMPPASLVFRPAKLAPNLTFGPEPPGPGGGVDGGIGLCAPPFLPVCEAGNLRRGRPRSHPRLPCVKSARNPGAAYSFFCPAPCAGGTPGAKPFTAPALLEKSKLAIQVPQLGKDMSGVAMEYSFTAQNDVPVVGSTMMLLKSPTRVPW